MLSSGAMLVRCDADVVFKQHVHETRGETFITVDDIPREAELFQAAFDDSILPTIHTTLGIRDELDFESSASFRLRDVVGNIALTWLKTMNTNRLGYDCQGAGNIGQWGRPIMLVGERYSDGTYVEDSYDHRALCGDRNGSAFLHRALDEMAVDLCRRFYITNLWKDIDLDRNEDELRDEMRLLEPTSIVALGKKSSKQLTSWGIAHGEVDHPQHRARFFHNNTAGYARDIYEASRGNA